MKKLTQCQKIAAILFNNIGQRVNCREFLKMWLFKYSARRADLSKNYGLNILSLPPQNPDHKCNDFIMLYTRKNIQAYKKLMRGGK